MGENPATAPRALLAQVRTLAQTMARTFAQTMVLAVATALALSGPAQAQLDPSPESGAGNYANCMDMASRNPEQAFEFAGRWEGLGGGDAARHCAAAALINLGELAEGATRLEALAEPAGLAREIRIGLLAQAGRAWMQLPDRERAVASLTSAIQLANPGPETVLPALPGLLPDLYLDRAVVLADAGDIPATLNDLNAALALEPGRQEALILRATARRLLGNLPGALADADLVVRSFPQDPEGLLERGAVHAAMGNTDAARADWRQVLAVDPDPNGPWRAKAQDNLARLELSPP
ncbi:MAG: hypothetical protein ACPGOY_14580 [Rhodospirillaceae bacterium]